MWNITVVDDSMSKQFSKEKGDQMAALPATVGGLSVDIPVGTVRRALAIAELSGSDTVSITISLERLVDLTQTVAGLVGQQLDEVVGQEKMSSDVEPGDGSGNRGAAASAALPVSPVEDEQGTLVGGPEVGDIYSVGTDFCFRMPDELMVSGVPTTRRTSACASEKKSVRGAAAAAALPVKQVTAEVRRVTLKRSSVSLGNRGSKKRKSREHECKLCSTCTFISTPVRRHAVRHHLPWFVVPDTACLTCKGQYGSSCQLKKHVDEERIKSDLDPHVDQEPNQMFGQEHVVEWCELGFGFVQQVADQTANGSLEGLMDWVKVCVTNKSEVELHMLDRELLSAFCVFLGNLPRKDELSALLGWRMVYSIMQVLAAEGSTIGEVPCKASPGGKIWHPSGLLPSVQAMYDGHSHLDRWSVEVGKREAR